MADQDQGGDAPRRLSQAAIEAAIKALAAVELSPTAESKLRIFIAFKALHAQSSTPGETLVDGPAIREVVEELFVLVPGPKESLGTIRLRSSEGSAQWLTNDTWRGSFQNYAKQSGRALFEDDDYREPLRQDALDQVVEARGEANQWPPRDVVAAILMRKREFPPDASWQDVIDAAAHRLALSPSELAKITSEPVLAQVPPLDGPEWDPTSLDPNLRNEADSAQKQGPTAPPAGLPNHVAKAVERVLEVLAAHGSRAIVALAGVPGTSKSHVARIAARAFADGEDCVREIQFSPGYTYEEFLEGPQLVSGQVDVKPGSFMQLNELAIDNPDRQFVLLIEEFTRADIPKVLGELLTYVEYRGEDFFTMYDRTSPKQVAPNLAIIATYNPTDRSAVALDSAILRRMRVLQFPPDVELLREMLTGSNLSAAAVEKLAAMFDACRAEAGAERFADVMPFGHAVFSSVEDEEDLAELWDQQLRPIMVRPRTAEHELYATIVANFPWKTASSPPAAPAGAGTLNVPTAQDALPPQSPETGSAATTGSGDD